jgi:surfeit locus 1 family protein
VTRPPLVPTVLVAIAVAIMLALGVWQLGRAREKERQVARLVAAGRLPPVAWPAVPPADDSLLFRRVTAFCLQPVAWSTRAGADRRGRPGWRYLADCRAGAEGPGFTADLGWAPEFALKPRWAGGPVSGVIAAAPSGQSVLARLFAEPRPPALVIVADRAAPGLLPSALPSPADIPNNSRGYAFQWFAFAAIAAIIYPLALRRRRQAGRSGGAR